MGLIFPNTTIKSSGRTSSGFGISCPICVKTSSGPTMDSTKPGLLQLLVLFTSAFSSGAIAIQDESRKVSVLQLGDGSLEVASGHRLNSRVVAWGALANRQQETGWLQLEISSNPAFPDHVQARAAGKQTAILFLTFRLAGIVEGYLTRNTISEYYKEFFANGVCLENPDFCAYMRKQIDVNERWIGEMVEEKEEEDPYWHMVNLFYSQVRNQNILKHKFQMDGITEGWKIKTEKQESSTITGGGDFDLKYGLRFHICP